MSRKPIPDAQAALQSAVTLYEQGLIREALDLVRLMLEQIPDDGKLWELRGRCHDALNDLAEATWALEMATTLVPLSAVGQCVLAKCYVAAGYRELAREMYRYVYVIPRLPDKLLPILAAGLGSVGEVELALETCRRAATRELDNGQPLYGMAHYMGRLGYPLEMIANVLRQAIELEPDAFQYRYALATICARLGRQQDAYYVLRPVVSADLLRGICCVNCLSRMEAIFASCGDSALSRVCRERRQQIDSHSSS